MSARDSLFTGVPDEELRVFTSYPVITFFAKDEEHAAQMLHELDDAINARTGISTELDEECYEVRPEGDDERWAPIRPEVGA